MTEKLEELLVAEFRDDSYDLPVDADRLTTVLRRRRARRTAATVAAAGAGVALAATLGVGAVNFVGSGPGEPDGAVAASPAASAQATVATRLTTDSVRLGDVVVRGLPAEAKLATDPAAALARPPAVELPATGDRAVLTVPSAAATEIRLVVVANARDSVGLPGVADDDEPWLSSLGGAHALLTVDGATNTTYLSARTPAGPRWHLAATGTDAAARLALIRAVTVATVQNG